MIERAQRTGDLGRSERSLDQHPSRVRSSVLRDPPVRCGLAARLSHARVQAEIGDELLGRSEPVEDSDCCDERERDGRVDARDRHQPLDLGALERAPAKLRVAAKSGIQRQRHQTAAAPPVASEPKVGVRDVATDEWELSKVSGELLLATFAEVERGNAASAGITAPGVSNPYIRLAPEMRGRASSQRTVLSSLRRPSETPDRECRNVLSGSDRPLARII